MAQCDLGELGHLVVVDTSVLQRRDIQDTVRGSTEGQEATAYFDGNSRRPSVIAVTYFGETGRVEEHFYLRDSATFVLHRDESIYAGPMSDQPPKIASLVRQVIYVCNGRPAISEYTETGGRAIESVRRLLGHVAR